MYVGFMRQMEVSFILLLVMFNLSQYLPDLTLASSGICDYADGTKKGWRSYAALAAAGYVKALLLEL